MKKLFFVLLLLFAFLCVSVSAAEIYKVTCSKQGVMLYEGNGYQKGTVDELFQFYFHVSADTKNVHMQGTGGNRFVVASSSIRHSEDFSMSSIEYTSVTEGTREFRFWAEGYDGSMTEYAETVILNCYRRDNSERTVYSVETDNTVYELFENVDRNRTRINLTICTSVNTTKLRMTTENGNVINEIEQHCAERGNCDIIGGKKYWKVYFQSVTLGERTFTFSALDNAGNAVGDSKSVSFLVVKPEEYEQAVSFPKGSSGTLPGTGEGETEGDDENATGTEDGVENGKDGQSDTDSNTGLIQKGENAYGNNQNLPEDFDENKTVTNPAGNYNKDTWQYSSLGYGNCCFEDEFKTFNVPAGTKNIVITYPDGNKINAVDQEKKNLAIKRESADKKREYWDIWHGDYNFNDLDVEIYNKNYEPEEDVYISKTSPFNVETQKKFDEAVLNERRIETQPNQRIITLTINDEYMTIDGERVEVDPGRGTKPLIVDGRTLLPVRAIVEALGGEIGWTASERKVTVRIFNRVIDFWIGKDTMTWNSIPEVIDVPAQIINDRTMLPIRFLAECLDHTDVTWEQSSKTVTIIYNY